MRYRVAHFQISSCSVAESPGGRCMSDLRPENGSNKRVRWAHAFPDLGTDPVPTDRCLSPEYFALEREKLFKRVWLKVGRVEEIPHSRDYKIKRLDFANTSVILVRGEDGQIRGFH